MAFHRPSFSPSFERAPHHTTTEDPCGRWSSALTLSLALPNPRSPLLVTHRMCSLPRIQSRSAPRFALFRWVLSTIIAARGVKQLDKAHKNKDAAMRSAAFASMSAEWSNQPAVELSVRPPKSCILLICSDADPGAIGTH